MQKKKKNTISGKYHIKTFTGIQINVYKYIQYIYLFLYKHIYIYAYAWFKK